jgi:hypothetical protein
MIAQVGIHYRAGYRFQLAETYTIKTEILPAAMIHVHAFASLTPTGLLTIYSRYAWDGASFPVLWRLRCLLRASLLHDVFYQMIRMGLLSTAAKEQADLLLYRIAREDGAWWPLAAVVYWARRFMIPATRPSAERLVMAAP